MNPSIQRLKQLQDELEDLMDQGKKIKEPSCTCCTCSNRSRLMALFNLTLGELIERTEAVERRLFALEIR